jgi:acyl carrier protein
MDEKIQPIRSFIVDTFLFGDDSVLREDTSFLQNGIIDSTGVLELITFLEKQYGIKIQDDELIPQNLDSLKNIGQFLDRKLSCVE